MFERSDYMIVNDSRLWYSLTGEGDPLILLHSGFTDHRIWEYQIEPFAQQYQVVNFDQRGNGQSDLPLGPFSHMEDLKALLETLEMKRVSLVGSSQGGGVAIDYALQYPERVKALVVVGSALTGYPYPAEYMAQMMELTGVVQTQGIPAGIEAIIAHPGWDYFFPAPSRPEARAKVIQAVRNSANAFRWIPTWERSPAPTASQRIGEIQCPVLIINGARDSDFVRQMADHLQSGIKQAQRVTMEGCSHLPYVEKPDEFNQIVLEFFKNCCA